MRPILLPIAACTLAAAALAACGPAVATVAAPVERPAAPVQVTGDGVHVTTSTETRVISASVDAPVGRVWQVLPQVYQELGLSLSADPGRRTVSGATSFTRRFSGEPATRYFDCGQGSFGGALAAEYTIRFTVSTAVSATAAGSRLDSVVEAVGHSNEGTGAGAAQCRTRGRLEALIATGVREKLAG
ncbi:MAG TPA: hypothetical protein VEX86_23115 [Longimicrobium sp.]|nr:hypothetical protein [Longimicrobium sp.]